MSTAEFDMSEVANVDLSDSMEDPVLLGTFIVSWEYWKFDSPAVDFRDVVPFKDEIFVKVPSFPLRSFNIKLDVGVLLGDNGEADLEDPALPSALGFCSDAMIFTMFRCFFIM